MYLNKFDFINNAVGIKSAAQVYFGKSPSTLKIEEAAMLVGMAKNPALFNPIRREELTKQRRNVVLGQMLKNDYIDQEEFDSLKTLDIVLDYHDVDHKEGIAPYFREILRGEVTNILNSKDKDGEYLYLKPDGSRYNMYRDGLKIYTTIDSRMQKYGEYAVSEHLGNELQKDFFRKLKRKKNAPFDYRVSPKQIDNILKIAMRRTSRYRVLAGKECGNCGRRGKYVQDHEEEGKKYWLCSAEDCKHKARQIPSDSIEIIFNTPVKTRVFSWKGEIDTIMSPMDSIRYYKSFLQAGFMSMDPHTGYIKAWVGGIDKKHFSYDHVKQGRRQVGSTFKPFVYALAIQEGYSPCYELPNVKTCFDMPDDKPDYCPKNSDGVYGCKVSLKYALANSMNTITAWILKQFGPQAVIDLVRKMGITSPLEPVPSLCLGVADLSVYEIVGANSTFANKGVWIEPTFLTRIEDKNGAIIKEFIPESHEVFSEETAFAMIQLMKGVVDGVYNECRGNKGRDQVKQGKKKTVYYTAGTGVRIRHNSRPYGGIKVPMAAKTGTTQNNSDGWFIGITPDLVTGVWVGAEDRSVRFADTYFGQGANMALPIYGYYINKVYADKSITISQEDFEKPDKPISIQLDCDAVKSTVIPGNYDPFFE